MSKGKTMLDKLWEIHKIGDLGSGSDLIALDRFYFNDLGGPTVTRLMIEAGYPAFDPKRTFCFVDHTIPSRPDRTEESTKISRSFIGRVRENCNTLGINLIGMDDPRQGVEHVSAIEMGLTLPGMMIAGGDSHTLTHGAMGAIAWGSGASEMYQSIATGTITSKKPKCMRITIEGVYDTSRVEAMDVALYLLSQFGTRFGSGYAVEFAGSAIRAMDIEDRATVCNLSQEMGADLAYIAPDDITYTYIKNREYAPKGREYESMVAHCRTLVSDDDAVYDKEIFVDITGLRPQISWGTTPGMVTSLGGCAPRMASETPNISRESMEEAFAYMGLSPGQRLAGTKVDWVFIGSCANSRLGTLKRAAEAVRGKHVAPHVTAWIVPGSEPIKREAEKLGLDAIFKNAGCFWGAPCCSLCCGTAGEWIPPYERCISTTNRNFIGRQGPNSRTHLAGPVTAVLAAVAGAIPDDLEEVQV